MPWVTPTLREVRELNRDYITGRLGSRAMTPNSVARVLADGNAGLAHLTLMYIDFLSRQFLPDTAESEWLDRHGTLWLKNSDGSVGRKVATFAEGRIGVTGIEGSIFPIASQFLASEDDTLYETTEEVVIGAVSTPVAIRAITPGAVGNKDVGSTMLLVDSSNVIDNEAVVIELDGGADTESNDELRSRVLQRIQHPPMGGDADDYIQWSLAVPAVTRAWVYPQEQGIGTVVVRFMCDNLRDYQDGFPTEGDEIALHDYLDTVRPVTVKDFWVVSPLRHELVITINNLDPDTEDVRASIHDKLREMILLRSAPGQIIYRSWVAETISQAVGENSHDLVFDNAIPPSPGHLPVLGSVIYG